MLTFEYVYISGLGNFLRLKRFECPQLRLVRFYQTILNTNYLQILLRLKKK